MAPYINDFLNQTGPENYVAGLGRGATGFVTRSDIGPSRDGPSEEQIKEVLAKRAAQIGTDASAFGDKKKKGDDNDEADDEDERMRNPEDEMGLFASGNYDKEDDEADRIYQAVDERMEKRRKARRELREKMMEEEFVRNNPKVQQQFVDLKRALGTVTDEEWAAIPEVGDLTGKNKRVKTEQRGQRRFYAVPDSLIVSASNAGAMGTTVQDDAVQTDANGAESGISTTNFAALGEARDRVLQVRLDQAAKTSTSNGTSTSVDTRGYLTSLNTSTLSAPNVGDYNRVKPMLEAAVRSNPNKASTYMALARMEFAANKLATAKEVIAKGCEMCPKSEDAWILNIFLNAHNQELRNAKIIAANALKQNERSVKLWEEAVELETDNRSKQRVLRQALDNVPTSVLLWKKMINLADEKDARLLMVKATEKVPTAIELWLALARMETPEQAQKILNKARQANPGSYEVWIAGCRLREQMGGTQEQCNTIMRLAVKDLIKGSAMLKRESWISEAEKCDMEGAVLSCAAIIKETIGWSLGEQDDIKDIWLKDAEASIERGRYATARAIYSHAISQYKDDDSVWEAAIDNVRLHGTAREFFEILEQAVQARPNAEKIWPLYIREVVKNDDIKQARNVISQAFSANHENETIWLAAAEVEENFDQIEQARGVLRNARESANTDRIWIRSAAFERNHGKYEEALKLINTALGRFQNNAKLYMMKGQIYQYSFDPPKYNEAREAYAAGFRNCPTSAPLWVLAARLEEQQGLVVRARSLLERARIQDKKNAELWLEGVRLERRAGKKAAADNLMAQAMKAVALKKTGPLWNERIWHLEARNQRKALALEAIKQLEKDSILFCGVARIFWAERRLDKAGNWFERAVTLDPDIGDNWAWYMKFLKKYGTPAKRTEVLTRFINSEPKHGEVWQQINKDPKYFDKKPEETLDLVMAALQD